MPFGCAPADRWITGAPWYVVSRRGAASTRTTPRHKLKIMRFRWGNSSAQQWAEADCLTHADYGSNFSGRPRSQPVTWQCGFDVLPTEYHSVFMM